MKTKKLVLVLIIQSLCITSTIYAQIDRCGVPDPFHLIQGELAYKIVNNITIPVIVHVVSEDDGTGNVPDWQIHNQIDTLNTTFSRSDTRYDFILAGISRTENNTWHQASRESQAEMDMTNSLAINPEHALNMYITSAANVLGWVITWPWDDPETSQQHGIVIDHGSLPGGNIPNYNWGYTATHEVGHYLGLYHTFQNGCNPPGDEVDDTPYHEVNFDCDINYNTCPQSGFDPIHNYMNYPPDPCYEEFTQGQGERMDMIVGEYKPSLGGSDLYINSDFMVASEWKLGMDMDKIFFPEPITIHENISLSFGTNVDIYEDIYLASGSKLTISANKSITIQAPNSNVTIGVQGFSKSTQNDADFNSVSEFIPEHFKLLANYPNPFNPATIIPYELPAAGHITLEVFDMLGRRVAVLTDGMMEAGTHEVTFDASRLASGVYLYRLTAGEFVQTRQMVLVK